ncbi:ArsR family transcriptional regulator [Demequina aurantiaca]|uniref:arsenate reductase/protein-tyrosine-phosphatase family protein n=1 Tax=Demequina aurantiaca TaxID=676200 RepID=UPI003D336033
MVELNRIGVLAALAEPHRLEIVDALALDDLSPTELSARTGQQPSLLAHHLSSLEKSGVVRRRRSDGDARRSYFTLAWDNPIVAATAAHGRSPGGTRVVFVCSANSARSQFAASLFARHTDVPVTSAGTVPAARVHPLAEAALAERGLAPLGTAPQQAQDILREGDIVIAVCDQAFEELGRAHIDLHWSIPDPAAGGPADFTTALNTINPRVARLADALTIG